MEESQNTGFITCAERQDPGVLIEPYMLFSI